MSRDGRSDAPAVYAALGDSISIDEYAGGSGLGQQACAAFRAPTGFSRTFTEQVAKFGLPAVPLHALRHGWATLALTAGVHPTVVQERLGHATIAITLDTYSHVTGGLHSDAAEQVASLVSATLAIG